MVRGGGAGGTDSVSVVYVEEFTATIGHLILYGLK